MVLFFYLNLFWILFLITLHLGRTPEEAWPVFFKPNQRMPESDLRTKKFRFQDQLNSRFKVG